MTSTETDRKRIALWWSVLTVLDRQRVREFRANTRLPDDLVSSYAGVVGGILTTQFGPESGVFDMPAALIDFLDED